MLGLKTSTARDGLPAATADVAERGIVLTRSLRGGNIMDPSPSERNLRH
jgi:hypothetical protein